MSLQDKLQDLLATVPRWVFLLAVPAVAFVIATGIALGIGVGGGAEPEKPAMRQRSTLTLANLDLPPTLTPVPTKVAEEVDPTNRQDCDAIRGTDYLSPGEREWYLANCTRTEDHVVQNTSGTGSGNQYVPASEFGLGDRLIIPSIGVNAIVNGAVVGTSGQMPDPVGYFNAVWYDFKNFPGVGGYVDGNLVLAAHVDCARCHDGSPGLALFYYVSSLASGATAQYIEADGTVSNYVVRSVAAYSPGANWSGILATGRADMTLVTCGGTWDPVAHEYSTRWVAYLDKVG